MKIQVRDVVSYLGRDYLVDGVVNYHLNGKRSQLARAVDGDTVLWVEPPQDDAADRFLVLKEIRDLEMAIPPPENICYRDITYVQRTGGKASVDVTGSAPERAPGSVQLWRYRAAGDLFVQIESSTGGVWMAAGESVHRGMLEILPGK
jgi:hypothetical protein